MTTLFTILTAMSTVAAAASRSMSVQIPKCGYEKNCYNQKNYHTLYVHFLTCSSIHLQCESAFHPEKL